MSSLQDRKLIVKIIQYFRSKILSGELDEGQVESLEVALQCLQSTFSANLSDPALQTDVDLLAVFSANAKEKVPTEAEKVQAEKLKNDGNDLMKEAKFEEALAKYSEAIQLHANPIFFCNRAAAYSKVERHNDAVEDCKIALQLDPSYSKAYGRMGLAYSAIQKYREARDAYKKALELEPGNESFQNNLKIAEEKLREMESQSASMGGGAGFPGFPNFGGAFNPMEMLNNPAIAQMAQQVMSDPNIINMMSSMFGGMAPPPPSSAPGQPTNTSTNSNSTAANGQPAGDGSFPSGTPNPNVNNPQAAQAVPALGNLLEMGQRFASMMQQQNPQLVEQLRQQFQQEQHQQPPPNNPDDPGNENNQNH